jgi:hypothetical protein
MTPGEERVTATSELPMTEAVRAVIRDESWNVRSVVSPAGWIATLGLLALGVMGAQFALTTSDATGRLVTAGMAIVGFGLVVVTIGLVVRQLRDRQRDLLEMSYLRTTGFYRVVTPSDEDSDRNGIEIGGERFSFDNEVTRRLGRHTWATVEYTRRSRLVLIVRDAAGEVVFQHPRLRLDAAGASPEPATVWRFRPGAAARPAGICPWCGEEVGRGAAICRHCNNDPRLTPEQVADLDREQRREADADEGYGDVYDAIGLVAGALAVLPLGITALLLWIMAGDALGRSLGSAMGSFGSTVVMAAAFGCFLLFRAVSRRVARFARNVARLGSSQRRH